MRQLVLMAMLQDGGEHVVRDASAWAIAALLRFGIPVVILLVIAWLLWRRARRRSRGEW